MAAAGAAAALLIAGALACCGLLGGGAAAACAALPTLLRAAAAAAAAAAATLLAARRWADNGGYLPLPGLKGRYYARRWASPAGPAAERLRRLMADMSQRTIGSVLPHRALHDARHMGDKIVFVVYDARTGQPAMFHMAFKAAYVHELVLHLGLVMVLPEHQGKHLQRVCLYNMMCCCLTYWSVDFVMTDIADSPSNTKIVSDNMTACYPSYREPCRRAEGWQRDIACFMMAHHREDFGTADDATLDVDSFVVRGSNNGCGGSAALVRHGATRRSRTSRVNEFVEHRLGGQGTPNELFHVGRCQLVRWAARSAMRASPALKAAACTAMFLAHMPSMFLALAIDRVDLLVGVFRSYMRSNDVTIQVEGVPYGNGGAGGGRAAPLGGLPSPNAATMTRRSGGAAGRPATSCLWVSNHYSWLDYGVLCMCSNMMLRVLVKSNIAEEGLGAWLLNFVVKRLNGIPYRRGDKSSGAAARAALREGLEDSTNPILVFPEGTSQVRGEPMPLRQGSFQVAYSAGRPVQPVALWYSEDIGLDPATDNIGGTANILNRSMLVKVKIPDAVHPEDFANSKAFCEAVERSMREAYDDISGARIYGRESSAAAATA